MSSGSISICPKYPSIQPDIVIKKYNEAAFKGLEGLIQRVALVGPLHVQVAQTKIRVFESGICNKRLGTGSRSILNNDRFDVRWRYLAFSK